ncbi:hypothetical protein IMCC26207_106135 [Actinobacteria bacterium IMCC26207]|nr:hypothetical protein IMCC26207_106135 [Actinobacteria bacterium IMCC26207]
MKKFLTIAALTTAVLMSGAACSSSEDAATTTTKADAAATSSTMKADSGSDSGSDSGADAASSGDPDVDAFCALVKSYSEEIAANPEQAQQIAASFQPQMEDLSAKMEEKYSESNPPPPAIAQAFGKCLSESVSMTADAMRDAMNGG